MANERNTEKLIRNKLNELNYGCEGADSIVEEQKSQIVEINKLMKGASKSGGPGIGAPEFIVTTKSAADFVITIECKASTKRHESTFRDKPKDYAVDGVLHYAKALSKSYNVIAVAASGETESELKISVFLWPKGEKVYKKLVNEYGTDVKAIIPFEDFIRLASFDPIIEQIRHRDLMAFSKNLHEFMRDHAKLTESEKPLLVSGTLIALKNKVFAKCYDMYEPEKLQKEWLRVINEEIKDADIPKSKKDNMTQPYSSIAVHPELGKSTKAYPKGVLNELIKLLNEKVWPFINIYHDFDVVGQFYGEFLKYTGGDKKSLGIVLTPRHITELFAELACLNFRNDSGKIYASKVLDICAGTGGFLISSMKGLIAQTTSDYERDYIKSNCLVGVEQQPNMYALAASNMILRGDGKANLYQGSCFDPIIVQDIKKHKCDIGMINPPYSQSDVDLQELVFVKHMLDCLVEGGTGIAIVPVSCAISPNSAREELLSHHTLEAVMSMPDELFYPVGVVTCIMVFKAHIPHEKSAKKTWFGYWKDDGFIKTKHKGRVDEYFRWETIKKRWVEQFKNREVHPGESVLQYVGENDEWCAEAYMETDYSKLNKKEFEKVVKNFALFKVTEDTEEE